MALGTTKSVGQSGHPDDHNLIEAALAGKAEASAVAAKLDSTLASATYATKAESIATAATTLSTAKVSDLPGKQALSYGDHLSRSRQRLAASLYRTFNITAIGCSPFLGQYAQNIASTDHVAWRAKGQMASLRSLFARTYGTVGEGVILMSDPRVTSVGAQTIGSTGISGFTAGGRRLTTTAHSATLTLTADSTASEIWIHGWWESDAKCVAPLVAVDGGTAAAPTQVYVGSATTPVAFSALGSDKDYTIRLTGLTAVTHTVVLTVAATTQVDVAGFSIWLPSNGLSAGNGGVAVNRIALGGGTVDTALYPTTNGANPRSNRLTFGRTQSDLVLWGFGVNEASTTGFGQGWSPNGEQAKNYYAYTTDEVNYITDVIGADVLLVSLQHWNPTQVGQYGEEPFMAVHERIAMENPRVAHLRLDRLPPWTTFATASAAGLMVDTIHTIDLGHADTARLIHQAIQ